MISAKLILCKELNIRCNLYKISVIMPWVWLKENKW